MSSVCLLTARRMEESGCCCCRRCLFYCKLLLMAISQWHTNTRCASPLCAGCGHPYPLGLLAPGQREHPALPVHVPFRHYPSPAQPIRRPADQPLSPCAQPLWLLPTEPWVPTQCVGGQLHSRVPAEPAPCEYRRSHRPIAAHFHALSSPTVLAHHCVLSNLCFPVALFDSPAGLRSCARRRKTPPREERGPSSSRCVGPPRCCFWLKRESAGSVRHGASPVSPPLLHCVPICRCARSMSPPSRSTWPRCARS